MVVNELMLQTVALEKLQRSAFCNWLRKIIAATLLCSLVALTIIIKIMLYLVGQLNETAIKRRYYQERLSVPTIADASN